MHKDEILTRKGKNLFNKNNRTRIYGYFASSGTTWSYNASAYSNKIPCKPNTTYTFRYNGNSTQAVLGVGSCSTDTEPSVDVGNVTVTQAIRQNSPTISTPVTITTGPNDKWLIVAYNVAEPQHSDMADNLQIEEGSTATKYEPYIGEFKTIGGIPGKNLFDASNLETGRYDDTGTKISDGACSRTKSLIEVSPNKTYTFSWSGSASTGGNKVRLIAFDQNNNFVSIVTSQVSPLSITIPANAKYLGISFINTITNMQLEEGNQATSYEPYKLLDWWQRAVPTVSTKGALTTLNNTRKAVNLLNVKETKVSTLNDAKAVTKPTYAGVNQGSTWTIGNNATFGAHAYGIVIPCKAGEKYTIKMFNASALGSSARTTYAEMNTSGVVTKGNTSYNTGGETITAVNTGFLCIQFAVNTTQDAIENAQIMIVKGNTVPTAYYPYFSPTKVLPSLKAFGGTIQRHKQNKLWSRYVPCDGITNALSTSIDTGVKAQSNMEMFIRFKAITGSFYILQARQNTGASIYGISGSQSGNTINFFDTTSSIVRTEGHIYTVKGTYNNGSVTLYVKDETTGQEDTKTGTSSPTFPSPTTIKLFGDASLVSKDVTVYRAYIKVNGEMAWDMYPAVDVVDSNKVVAYDDVTHAASEKLSGSFTGGELIQPIAYAESDGTAWADTGVPQVKDIDIDIDFALTTATQGTFIGIVAGTTASASYCVYLGSHNTNGFYSQVGGGAEYKYLGVNLDTARHKAKYRFANNTVTVSLDNTSVSYSSTQDLQSGNIIIGARANTSASSKARYHSAQIGSVRDYIPVRIGTTVEMLDLVNWQFATRTGSFTAGPDIPYDLIVPQVLKCNKGDIAYGQYGKNLFDKSLYDNHGWYYSGGVIADASAINTTVVIRAIPGKTYYFKHCSVAGGARVMYTTEENWSHGSTCEWLIASPTAQQPNTVLSFTVPSDAKWIFLLAGRIDTATTATLQEQLNDFMMSEEVITADTPYEPYHFGLHADGTHKVFLGTQGVVDLGSLTWSKQSFGDTYVFVPLASEISDIKMTTSLTNVSNGFIDGYTLVTYNGITTAEKTVSMLEWQGSKYIRVHDTRFTDAASFKAAMSGKYLFYQRNTDASFITPTVININDLLYSANDYTDIQTGKKHNEWDIKVLDGVTNGLKFNGVSSLSTFYFSSVTQTGALPTMTIYCTHFLNRNAVENWVCYAGNNAITFHHSYPTVAEANAWLASEYAAGHPVIVIVPKATPTDTDIVTEKVVLTTKGSKTIAATAEIPVTVQATDLEK